MAEAKCSRCMQVIAAGDTLSFEDNLVLHLDCRRPRDLSPQERAILFKYCFGHSVAECVRCNERFRQEQLGSDLIGSRTLLCPCCRADLTDSVRAHVYACVMLPQTLRARVQAARDAARRVVKQSQLACDRADVLIREAEAAIAALRETIGRTSA